MNATPDHHASADASMPNPSGPCYVVGLGASAGGIKALQTFFDHMAADSNLVFVVIMHLSPDHTSNLVPVIQQRTWMPVTQVTERTRLMSNHVYVIPPNKHLSVENNHLQLIEPQQPAGRRLAIDLFLRTLSVASGPRAVAIILSGTDSDGAIGIKHIKEQGGLTIVQDPAEAEYDGMPRSVIETGMVDWVLPVAEIPARLQEFMRNEQRMHLPPETPLPAGNEPREDTSAGGPLIVRQIPSTADEAALADVLRVVRAQTGHDFSHYKRATVLRRVARRMQVNLLEDLVAYLAFLRSHPAEANALLHDLLISVTNFFRDPAAFHVLESHIPQLFADKQSTDQVRVWSAGCANAQALGAGDTVARGGESAS